MAALVLTGYLCKKWILARESYADNYVVLSAALLAGSALLLQARRYHWFSRASWKALLVFLLLFDFSAFNTWGILEKRGGISDFPSRLLSRGRPR